MNKTKSKIINLVPKKVDPDKMSHQQKKDELIKRLKELIIEIETGELLADQALLLFYKEDDTNFEVNPRLIGMYNTTAVFVCELGKSFFINGMMDYE